MQQAMMRPPGHFCFFTKNNPRKMKADKNSLKYFDDIHSSYILDVSNKTGSVFMLNQKDLCVIDPKQLEEILNKNTSKKVYDEYDFGGDDPVELTMARLSPCETLMAIVNPSNIVVIYLPEFLSQKEPKVETNFEINGHQYAYIEWPPLNDIYCASKLRTHFISGDEMFSNLDEHFRCATFSVDGGLIYAINYHQELFMIDPLNVQIVSRRKLDELQTTSTIISIQMMQITPKIMVIGSLCKSPQEQIESSLPYLLLLSGDLLDPQTKFNMVPFKMHLSQAIKPDNLPDFRFHYVKERQLLLFSHTESSKVQALQLDENGDLAELDSIDLEGASTRGFVFYKGTFSRDEKQQLIQVEYQNRRFVLPNGPRIFILDSEGFMHHFNYYDTRYTLQNHSILVDPMKVEVLKAYRPVPAILANRSMIPPSSPRGGLQSNGMMMGGNNNMMGGGQSNMMMGNNNPFGLGQMNNQGGGGGMGGLQEESNDQMLKMKKPRMVDDDEGKRNQGGQSGSLFTNQQTNNPFPNMMGGGTGGMNNGGTMGNSNMMNNNNNNNINGRELRSGTLMPPKVNIVPPQTQMPARNDAMPPSLRDLQSQRNIRKLGNTNEGAIGQMGQMGQMGGGNNVNPNLNQTATTPTFPGGMSQQNQVSPFASQQQNNNNNAVNPFASQQNNQVNPFASQQNNSMMNSNGISSNLPNPVLTNQQSFNPNQQQGNNSMPPPSSMGNNFQSNLQNKPVNPFQASQQQQNNPFQNPQQKQNNNGMGNPTMPNTLQFQSQRQGANPSLNPNVESINPNAQNSLQQQQQGMQQGNGELHFQQLQQQQPNMMNQVQVYVGPTAEQIAAERIREQEEIVKKNKRLFEGLSIHMRQAGMAFDDAKDLFPQRRKELLHWIKRQKVRDFGNLKRIYKQFFDDSAALDLELVLLGQELNAKVNIINDVKGEDAHSKALKGLMSEIQKRNAKLDNHMGIAQRYLENQEKILSVTPGLEPRKVEYKETDGADTIQFFSQGGGSKLGRGSLTKSFKQSLGGPKPVGGGGFGQQKERVDLFGDENWNPKTGNFPRFDKTYEHKKRAAEEKWMKVQEISNSLFEERTKDVEDLSKRLKKAKKHHTMKQREAEVSKKKIIFFDLSEGSSDESDEIKAANQQNPDPNEEATVKPQVSYEKIDKFFSQILMDLSSKYHFDEILQSSYDQSYDYSSPQEAKPKNNLLSRPSYSKLHEPSVQTTSNSAMNDLLLRVRNAKRRELDRPLISADILHEEKLWIKRAEAELEEERLAMEARRKMEEMEAEAAAAKAKKKAEEEAARQKREMEAQKRAQEARFAQEQMMQRKAQEEAKKQEQKPSSGPGPGAVQTQLQFQKPPMSKENPPAGRQPQEVNPNKMKPPAEKNTGNPALDDTIVIDDNDDKNQEGAAPGGNILPADILGNNTEGEDPFIKELIGNAQMSQGEIEALKKAKAVAQALKQEVLNARYNPEETVFIVTLKNIPKNWTTETLRHKLTQMQRKFEGLKVEPTQNVALLRVMGFREAIRVYILDEQNIDGYVIQAEIKVSQKQQRSGPSPGIGGGVGIGPGPGANVSVSTGPNSGAPQGYPMQGRTIRTITNPFPSGPSMNNQQQQQQMGGNRFQTNPNANPNVNPQQQSFPSPGPRFGQSTNIGQSPAFGQPGFGQGNPFMASPSLGGRAFGAPPLKFGQTSMPSPGLNQGGMNQGGFGGFGGQGQGQGQGQQFMGFQGAVQQQNQMQGGFMGGGGQNPGNSAADFFGAPRR